MAAVALEAHKGSSSLSELAARYKVSERQILDWHAQLIQNGACAFEPSAVTPTAERHQSIINPDELARTIAENSTHGLTMMDDRGYCVYANHAMLAMTGYSAEEIRSAPLHNLIHHHHPDGRPYPLNECPIDRALPENFEVRAHEDVFFRKDGSTFPVLCAASPIFRNGRPVATVIEIRNITERKFVEKRLIDSEREAREAASLAESERDRLNALLTMAPVGIAYVDRAGKLILANPEMAKIWGEHPFGESTDDFQEWKGWWADRSERHGHPIQPTEWAVARALNGEHVDGDLVEIEQFNRPGNRRAVLIRAVSVLNRSRQITGVISIQIDITGQVETEHALRTSEAHLSALLSQTAAGICEKDLNGRIFNVNERYCEILGRLRDDLIGRSMHELTHPDDLRRNIETFEKAISSGASYQIEKRYLRPDGSAVWVNNTVTPIRVADQLRTDSVLSVVIDVTEQKNAELALRKSNKQKDEFLAMLAHELRNPLAPISTAAQLLRINGVDEKRIKQSSEIISRQVKHMTNLVDDLLDVSRVTRGLVELQKTTLDIKAVIGSAIEQSRPLMEARNQALTVRLGSVNAYVVADRTRIIQVLTNLLNNAAKYTPQAGEITVRLDVQNNEAAIRVADNGIGIELSLLPHIFELFTQAHRTPDRSQGGLGLGLALVHSIMELHGGRVAVHSEGLGKGSEFSIYLPLSDAKVISTLDSTVSGLDRASRPKRILIVDDNVDAAESLAALLEAEGHWVRVEVHPFGALKSAQEDPPEVFILDIGLPDMNGYELAVKLKEQDKNKDALYLALTGYGQSHDRALSFAAGFAHHFVKPVDADQLTKVLGE